MIIGERRPGRWGAATEAVPREVTGAGRVDGRSAARCALRLYLLPS